MSVNTSIGGEKRQVDPWRLLTQLVLAKWFTVREHCVRVHCKTLSQNKDDEIQQMESMPQLDIIYYQKLQYQE